MAFAVLTYQPIYYIPCTCPLILLCSILHEIYCLLSQLLVSPTRGLLIRLFLRPSGVLGRVNKGDADAGPFTIGRVLIGIESEKRGLLIPDPKACKTTEHSESRT